MNINNYNEFIRVRVPQYSGLPYLKQEDSLPDFPLQAGCSFSVKTAGYHDAMPFISSFFKGKPFAEWAYGTADESPLKEKKLAILKNQTLSLPKKFSASLMAQVMVGMVAITNSYFEQFNFLLPIGNPGALPKVKLANIGINFYSNAYKASTMLKAISKSNTKESAEYGFGSLFATIFKVFSNFLSLVTFVLYHKSLNAVAPLINFSLAFGSYLGLIIELVQNSDGKPQRSLSYRANPAYLPAG